MSFSHAATVRTPNAVYPAGTTLRDRPAYFTAIEPVLNGSYTFRYAAPRGDLSVRSDAELVFRSVERGRNGNVTTVYWSRTRPLDARRVDSLPAGDRLVVPFSFNVSRLVDRRDRMSERIGHSPGQAEALVRVALTYDGTVDGRRVNRTRTYAMPVTLGETYHVLGNTTETHAHPITRTVTVPNRPGPLRRVGGPALLLASLAALGALLVLRRTGRLEPTAAERDYADYRDARAEFEEWIHAVTLPDGAADLPRGEAATLADLVDLAIDANAPVLHPPGDDAYYVFHDGYRYVYEPPTLDDERAEPALAEGDDDSTDAQNAGDADDGSGRVGGA
ncbi:MAG: DUF5305 domain-containing protein [Halarchaeum sp.]